MEQSRDMTQEEIQEQFDKADKLFEGKKFEDGAVVSEETFPNTKCLSCGGVDGHHFMNCSAGDGEVAVSVESDALPLEQNEAGDMLPGKLPPSAEELMSSDLMWLIAKCCHEVNRAYCASIGDHSHLEWRETSSKLRASILSGVEYHRQNPGVSPEDSHAKWMEYKLAEGWKFGNAKDEEARTHPNLIPFHQLHAQERVKDSIFTAICDTFFGEKST